MELWFAALIVGGGVVLLTPLALAAAGFTSGGIAAGSIGARMMSFFAISNRGGVAAGGLVAFLQQIGTVVYIFGGVVLLTPLALAAAGFTSGGIAAGSIGARMMSCFAISNGGGVAAGGLVAFLQQIGAAGLSVALTVAGIGAVVVGILGLTGFFG